MRQLEPALIDTLADFGVAGSRREGFAGVWIDACTKIAAIGVGVRRWVTLHGFALNVDLDLAGFEAIVPCGLHAVEMTSIARELGDAGPSDLADRTRERVRDAFLDALA